MVNYTEGFGVFVHLYVDGHIAQFHIGLAEAYQGFHLLRSVYSVGYQLSEKYFLIRVQKFLDNGKDVFRFDIDFSC